MVSWIQSLFCKHEWQYKKTVRVWWDQDNNILDEEYDKARKEIENIYRMAH